MYLTKNTNVVYIDFTEKQKYFDSTFESFMHNSKFTPPAIIKLTQYIINT